LLWNYYSKGRLQPPRIRRSNEQSTALLPLQCGQQSKFRNRKQKIYDIGCVIILFTFIQKYYSVIQGVSRLVDITAGGDFLGLCDQKSSNKRVSDFGRLWSYDHFKIRIEVNNY